MKPSNLIFFAVGVTISSIALGGAGVTGVVLLALLGTLGAEMRRRGY